MKSAIAATFLIAGVLHATAQPHHTYTIVGNSDNTAVFLDYPSRTKDGDRTKAWTLWVYYPDKQVDDKTYNYELLRSVYNCRERSSALLSSVIR